MVFGVCVVIVLDLSGMVVDESGFMLEKLVCLCEIKVSCDGCVVDYVCEFGLIYLEGQQFWSVLVDIVLLCVMQNELDVDVVCVLIVNGVKVVVEGVNMLIMIEVIDFFFEVGVLFVLGKVVNVGGVVILGLEMVQNVVWLSWKVEKVDVCLYYIMLDIYYVCVEYGGDNKYINYVQGVNIVGFVKVVDVMLVQGVI